MIKIRGVEVTSKDKVTIDRKFSEEHDTGQIKVISNRSRRYEMNDLVEYTKTGVSEQMLIESDSAIQLNANEYEHTITLIETKAKFDGIYPADRSFTVINQTLEDILNVYKRELAEYHDIDIDWSLTTAQLNNISTAKEFSGVNFTTILVSLFRKIDAIPYVIFENNKWTIYARPYNERGSLISGESTSKSFSQNTIDYATKVKSQLKNAINERAQVDIEYFPSENGYILPKSPKPIKQTSDLEYQLPSPIVQMLEVIAIDVPYKYSDGEGVFFYGVADVDITSQVIQKQVYDTLSNTTATDPLVIAGTNNLKNNVYYNLLGNTINQLYEDSTDKRFFININTSYLLNAIIRVLKPLVDATIGTFVELEDDTGTDVETGDIKLRFKYIKKRDIDLVTHRKTKGDMNTTTTIHNQRDTNIEVSQYKRALNNYANRMGNDQYTKTKTFQVGETPHSIGDYLADGKVVVQVRNTYHGNFTFCEWVEVDNFANLETEYAISRSPDPYTITSKTVQTNIVSEEYVFFSETDLGINTRLDEFGQRGLLGLFESANVPNFEKMHSAVFKPVLASWDDTKAISMELANDGDSNLITMHAFFDHQLLAGNIYYDIDTSSYVDYFQPLKYTDNDGTLEDFQIYFVPDINFEDGGEYPLILDETEYLAEAHTFSGVDEPIDLDINAAFAFTYNINFVADKDIFVGEFLARNNYLIADQQDTHTMEIYKSSKPYTLSDLTNRTGDTLANMTYTYDFANRKITFNAFETISHFALTKNGNILLAINRDMTSGESLDIYINIVKNLSDIFFNLEASATGLANLSGSALLAYFYLHANATDLATISGNGVLAYTSRIYPLNATANNLSAISGNGLLAYTSFDYVLQANATGLSIVSGSAILGFTPTTFVLQGTATDLSSINGTVDLNYTLQNHLLSANGTVGNISGSITLAYTDQNYTIAATSSGISSIGGTINMSYTYQVWDFIGTSAPPQDGITDLGTSGTASCRTSTEAGEDLQQTVPASERSVSFIMKVEHDYEDPTFGTSPCTPFYYRNIEVTE